MSWSASKTDLLFACQYSFRTDVADGFDPGSEARDTGDSMHSATEAVLLGEVPASHVEAANGVALWLSQFVTDRKALHIEEAIAWNAATGTARSLGRGRAAYENALPNERCGTADCMAIVDGVLHCWDWKSGEFGAQKARMQLRTLAVMGAALFGVDTVRTFSVFVDATGNEPPRVVVSEELGPLELAEHASALRDGFDRVKDANPVLGEHCNDCFCGQRGACPERAALVESMSVSANLVQLGRSNPLTAPLQSDQDAAALLELLPHVESYIKTRKAEAQDYVDKNCGGEVRLNDTHVYRKTQSSRKGIRGEEAFSLAKKLGATPEELAACIGISHFDRWSKLKKGA